MITKGTILNILDNSGATKGLCIHVYNKSGVGFIGTKVLVSIIQANSNISSLKTKNIQKDINTSTITKGSLFKGKIITTKYGKVSLDHSCIKLSLNGIVLFKSTERDNNLKSGDFFSILPIANRFLLL